jgi:phosphoadenosine phosphosulfate reductase
MDALDPAWPMSAEPEVERATDRVRAAEALLRRVLVDGAFGRAALVSSFGADSAVLLHLAAGIATDAPVLFVDSGKLFDETLAYRDRLVAEFGLRDVRTVGAEPAVLARRDPTGERHLLDPDGCCELRKVQPLEAALAGFDVWITGRRRHQAATRAGMERLERDAAGRRKLNPLADWSPADVAHYRRRHHLPAHPLESRGYKSIGCAPCTTAVRPDEDPRAGRWRHLPKTECGLHGST